MNRQMDSRTSMWALISEAQVRISRDTKRRFAFDSSVRGRLQPGSSLDDDFDLDAMEVMPWGVVNPHSQRKISWDVFVSCCVVYLTFSMPFSMGFDAEADWQRARYRNVLDMCVDCVFALDMLICFRTAYSGAEGPLVTDPRTICGTYLRGGFLIDFLSIASRVESLFGSSSAAGAVFKNARLLRVVRLAKLFKLSRLLKLKSNKVDPTEDEPTSGLFAHPGVNAALSMIVYLFVIAHMMACSWHGLVVLKRQKRGHTETCSHFFCRAGVFLVRGFWCVCRFLPPLVCVHTSVCGKSLFRFWCRVRVGETRARVRTPGFSLSLSLAGRECGSG